MAFWLIHGSNLEALPTFAECSVDSIVTDPPYELGFMGRRWDSSGIAYRVDLWRELLRVLKPGAHLLAFGGSRTYHRMTCAIEDAGFEVRDCLQWLYGTGFPKSLDVSKAIDAAAGADREVIGSKLGRPGMAKDGSNQRSDFNSAFGDGIGDPMSSAITAPATDAARQWQGWGTALKPACEPIVMARKPLIGTVAVNVQAHGTGGINVDACRIATDDGEDRSRPPRTPNAILGGGNGTNLTASPHNAGGRWPTNVILDAEAAAALDEQAGDEAGASRFFKVVKWESESNASIAGKTSSPSDTVADSVESLAGARHALGLEIRSLSTSETPSESKPISESNTQQIPSLDERFSRELPRVDTSPRDLATHAEVSEPIGTMTITADRSTCGSSVDPVISESTSKSPAPGVPAFEGYRFAYVVKPTREERDQGCAHLARRSAGEATDRQEGSAGLNSPRAGAGRTSGARNHHPTVKPIELMRYLCRLVTPPGGLVLDPFCGSGSTGCGAILEGFAFTGIELEAEYLEIARARIELAARQLTFEFPSEPAPARAAEPTREQLGLFEEASK